MDFTRRRKHYLRVQPLVNCPRTEKNATTEQKCNRQKAPCTHTGKEIHGIAYQNLAVKSLRQSRNDKGLLNIVYQKDRAILELVAH